MYIFHENKTRNRLMYFLHKNKNTKSFDVHFQCKWKSGFGAKVTKEKVRGVVGCLLFWQRGSKLYQKTTQRISIWYHFHPILHQLGAKGDLKINKNNNKLKTCKPKYKQNEKS